MECFLAIPAASHAIARSVARASLIVSHTPTASSRTALPSGSLPPSPLTAARFSRASALWGSRSRVDSDAIWAVHSLPQESFDPCDRRVRAGRGAREGRGQARRFVTRASAEGGSIGGDERDEVSSRFARGGRRSTSSDGSSSDSESSSDGITGGMGSGSGSGSGGSESGSEVEFEIDIEVGVEAEVSAATPPQDVLLKAVSEASRMAGRQARTTNVVMGGTASEYGDDWLELDKKVNTYPSLREFTAIGSGGDDFAVAMVGAVQSVIQRDIPELQVVTRESAKGKYISVRIGPVRMESSDQVRAVYQAMKQDPRMRYFL